MIKRKKILFFIPQLVGGGAERVAINIMQLLDKDSFEVHLVVTTLNGSVYKKLPEGIFVHNLKVKKTLLSISKLKKLITTLDPNIVYSSLIRGNIAIYLALLTKLKKPYLVFRSPNSPKLLIENNQIGIIEKYLLEKSYNMADIIIAQTPEMKDEISYYHNINLNKIETLLNPIDTDSINKKLINISNPFDMMKINVVAAGRITYQKGFDILIKSFKKVVDKNSLFKLYIIGEGQGEEFLELQNLVKELNLENNIIFVGYTDNPYKYFYFSDLYVLSSRWEGLPNTILENLYLRKPIIATKCIPFMNDLIKDKVDGILVDVENIDELSESILNYKSISIKSIKKDSSKDNINNFFKNLKV